jgi:putative toxin-antitoxin system antitoxin component (TIGR02293 family)
MERAAFVTRVAGGTRKAAALLQVDAAQTSRWATGASVPGPEQSRMLVDVEHVLTHALLVWDDDEVARDWLITPNAHLDGVAPIDWIKRRGTSEVVDALRAEAAGAYA